MSGRCIREKLHISTIDANARDEALRYGVGLETADFCWALRLDEEREKNAAAARDTIQGIKSLWFHAPFAELAACAIDPKVLALTRERYLDSISLASSLGINRVVIHGGYIPYVYFPESYVERSILFWHELLPQLPPDVVIALENVMEPRPSMLVDIVSSVNDGRLGLCLDVGHANCEISDTPPIEWIKPMAPFLRHVHLHNNFGTVDLHNCLFDGSMPMLEIIERVSELAPCATFTIENQHAEASLEWLCANGML